MARPKAKIDLQQVEALAALQATYPELAAVLGVSESTIEKKMAQPHSGFYGAYKKGKEKGKTSLRRLQWKAAQGITWEVWKCDKKQSYSTEYFCDGKKAKNKPECKDCAGAKRATIIDFKGGATGMQIWLGKQWLDQAEKHEVAGKDGGPLTTSNTNTTITGKMTDKEAAALYAQMVKGNG